MRSLSSTQPATKIGQVVWAWGEIEAALAAGTKLRAVWEAATLDGFAMSYAQFRVYVSLVRRRHKQSWPVDAQPPAAAVPNNPHSAPTEQLADPFKNLREQREKKQQSGFDYDPFSLNKKLI